MMVYKSGGVKGSRMWVVRAVVMREESDKVRVEVFEVLT